MATEGANTANSIIAGFSKLNFSRKTEVKGKQSASRRRKLSQMLPTLDESLTASMLLSSETFSEAFSLEFDSANKPQMNSFDQSQNTLATVECSESSDFFSYHSDGEEEISIRELSPPSSPVQANIKFDYTAIQTPECSNAFGLLYPGSPLAKRRRRPILPQHVRLGALESLPGPPLTA